MCGADCNWSEHEGFDGFIESKSGKEDCPNHCPVCIGTYTADFLIVDACSQRGGQTANQPPCCSPSDDEKAEVNILATSSLLLL
jgi:hypothetical protein